MIAPDTRSPFMPTYGPPPVEFVRGEGTVLFDTAGRRYLDFLSGIAVTSLGHARAEVAEALATQAGRLLHVSNLFANEHAGPLAVTIDRLIGDGEAVHGQIFFCNSGAEANECAIKLVRKASGRGRHAMISAYGSFHGRTLASLHATGQPDKHEAFQPLPEGFRHVAFGDMAALAAAADPTAVGGVLLEGVQGEGGVLPAPAGYLRRVRELCDERGLLLVMDEVQTGFGRTGRWFSFQHDGVLPDIVTMAKSLGNGVPIGACWARAATAAAFEPGDHGSTFGGQPLACAAARATLAVMEELDAPRLAAAAGDRLAAGIAKLGGVEQVRGRGLLLGVVLEAPLDAKEIVRRALSHGLVLNAPVAGVLRLAPPLTVSAAEIDEAVAILSEVLTEVRR